MRDFSRPQAPAASELEITATALEDWKSGIAAHQAIVRSHLGVQQTLFEVAQTATDANAIDPWTLEMQNFFFFKWSSDRNPNEPCIYFVVDLMHALLLYVGETCHASQRWTGYHDCKRYVLNYQTAHFKHHIPTSINIAFWWDTPQATRPRQTLESALIQQWRAPFNKENWGFWKTPFVYRDTPRQADSRSANLSI
jgi:hypothetical protein